MRRDNGVVRRQAINRKRGTVGLFKFIPQLRQGTSRNFGFVRKIQRAQPDYLSEIGLDENVKGDRNWTTVVIFAWVGPTGREIVLLGLSLPRHLRLSVQSNSLPSG